MLRIRYCLSIGYYTLLNKEKSFTDLCSDLSFIFIDLFDQKVKSVTRNRADKDLVQSNCLNYFKISIEQQQNRFENYNIALSQPNLPKSFDLNHFKVN